MRMAVIAVSVRVDIIMCHIWTTMLTNSCNIYHVQDKNVDSAALPRCAGPLQAGRDRVHRCHGVGPSGIWQGVAGDLLHNQRHRYMWRCHDHEDGFETNLRKGSWFIHKALQLKRTSQPPTPRVKRGQRRDRRLKSRILH